MLLRCRTVDCPRCFTVGGLRSCEPYEAWGCAECRGIWLTIAAARRLLEPSFGPIFGLPQSSMGHAALRCPGCAQGLARCKIAEVEIDVCLRDGVWFDHEEIQRIQAVPRGARGAALATAAVVGTAVAAEMAGSIYGAPGSPSSRSASADAGAGIDGVVEVVDVGATAIDAAAGGGEVVVEGATGVLDLLSGLFDVFSIFD